MCSPTKEECERVSHGVIEIVGKSEYALVNGSEVWSEGLNLKRPYSGCGHDRKGPLRPVVRRRSSSLGSLEGGNIEQDFLGQREHSTGIYKTRSVDAGDSFMANARRSRHEGNLRDALKNRLGSRDHTAAPASLLGPLPAPGWYPQSQVLPQALNGPGGILPLLTPPEDLDSFKWNSPAQTESIDGVRTASDVNQTRSQDQTQSHLRTSSSSRPSGIQMPERSNMAGDESGRSNWLGRASQHLGKRNETHHLIYADFF